ncbi:hypothetical protein, partial [Blautia wexlerae]|uniref:hypothetical protein n=1 Tax=Blautia wexlerae TaxID=418240 RepID=UPI0034A29733
MRHVQRSRHTPLPRAAGATIGALGVAMLLTSCTGVREWAVGVGEGWDNFGDDPLVPMSDLAIATLVYSLCLVVLARLATLLPMVRNLRWTRRNGRVVRAVGWLFMAAVSISTVLIVAAFSDELRGWLALGIILGLASIFLLAPGLATVPRIDAHVIATDGSKNTAWSIDALLQVRELNADDPGRRVEHQTSPDFSEFITVADRSGNALASVATWVVQTLFNSSPWLLQVTMLDRRSAIAILRRNGLQIGEEHLQLDSRWAKTGADADAADQHRKLLALAAAFAAMKMAERYPDVRGFYGAEKWRSLGYLGIAQMTDDVAEQEHYLQMATELEPR